MGVYIHLFKTENEFTSAYTGESYHEPWVSYTEENEKVKYNKTRQDILLETPLTLEALTDGTIGWRIKYTFSSYGTPVAKTVKYSKNGGEWTEITSASGLSYPKIDVLAGDIIQFVGNNVTYGGENSGNKYGSNLIGTCDFIAYGNIMSLLRETGFANLKTTMVTGREYYYTFTDLFDGNYSHLKDVSDLQLPATQLSTGSYDYMFKDCTSITIAPVLPSPASEYTGMFYGCTNLNYVKCLATDGGSSYWMSGVQTVKGTFVKAPGAVWLRGAGGIPENWTVVEDIT